jgi:hypothetical protein
MMVSQKFPKTASLRPSSALRHTDMEVGQVGSYHYLKRMDSGIEFRNDKPGNPTFYEVIKYE